MNTMWQVRNQSLVATQGDFSWETRNTRWIKREVVQAISHCIYALKYLSSIGNTYRTILGLVTTQGLVL